MKWISLILILHNFATTKAHSQSFTVDDLITLTSLQPRKIDRFMDKNGFAVKNSKYENAITQTTFSEKARNSKNFVAPKRTVDIYLSDDSKYFVLHTSSLKE